MKLNQLPELHGIESVVNTHGTEEGFLEFNAKVRKFLGPHEKKLRSMNL